ncbi:DUF2235 domain-containing protein [Marinobacter sp. R17]|uniref:T6SS phospholipase effector Tle1-like catalytic domain-containing protein n=1 Tax=Marinobacter sp. R17 TaxID=2484250 RepID=UPI000F4CF8D0|nr:DUF2235 domain-containing protein [Marinobacter sp. R17]ROT96168.1 DUF2235 domain-containing protein [Marinobacter sp. R17]
MQIKHPRDLTLRDLPRIESPEFAPSSLPLSTSIASPSLSEALRLADDFIGSPYRSDSERMDRLRTKLRDGSLVMVKGITDTPPFSPLIAWQNGGALPGRWTVLKDVHGLDMASRVTRLNDWQITPEQVEHLGPGGVGHLSASSFDSDLREQRAAEREQVRRDSQKNLSLPVGAAAGVAPLEAQSEEAYQEKPEKKLIVELGLFLDGTLNNAGNIEIFRKNVKETCLTPHQRGEISDQECRHRLALIMGDSYANGETNVSKLYSLYREAESETAKANIKRGSIYGPGVGTSTGSDDSLISSATGLWHSGIIHQVTDALEQTASRLRALAGQQTVDQLTIDIFGFSRGSAAVRHAVSEIAKGKDGQLGSMVGQQNMPWPEQVEIRFVGLFDTVAGIVNLATGDLSASNDITDPVNIYLDPENVKAAVHLTAADECRETFALNSLYNSKGDLPGNFFEISLPGAHSDVGGGYHDESTESVRLARQLTLADRHTQWPEESLEWDNLNSILEKTKSEGWVGKDSIEIPTDNAPYLGIKKHMRTDPPPYGRVKLSLEMNRHLRGELSRIPLHLMHEFALKADVPFEPLDSMEDKSKLPKELDAVYQSLSDQVVRQGKSSPELQQEMSQLLRQRYIHHSDNFNTIEFMLGDMITEFELPFEPLMPFTPASNRDRIIHPNEPENS